MLDIKQFSALHKSSSTSFHHQKALIKKVMAGKKVSCENCLQRLSLSEKDDQQHEGKLVICCVKGCTHIELDLA
jgi:hypothetical protein